MAYQRADTAWFADSGFGISAHWTAQSVPVAGEPLAFDEAVEKFDVDRFLDGIALTGAGYLLFTSVHALQKLPAPCTTIDRLLSRRTTRRDLLGELMDGCCARGMRFIVYYNHSCNSGDDKAWEQAVGYHGRDQSILARNICDIVTELGTRYGQRVAGWWFDSCYSLDPSGPVNTVTTDLHGFRFPWEALTVAAKAGFPGRLVSYNAGAAPESWRYLYTTHQDYLAGESPELTEPPVSRWACDGLQNHRWTCVDNTAWVHAQPNTSLWPARFGVAELVLYLRTARAAQTPVTFNVDTDQLGHLCSGTLELLRQAGEQSQL